MNVLVVGVHIDDCEFGVGGTTALLTKLGHEVTYLNIKPYMHYMGGDVNVDKKSIASAEILGAKKIILDYNETKYYKNNEKTIRATEEVIRDIKPEIMFIMHPKDNHIEHVECAKTTREAIFAAAVDNVVPNEIYTYEAGPWQSMCYMVPDFSIDIEPVYDKVKDSMLIFAEKHADGERLFREKDRIAKLRGHAGFFDVAEGFKILKYPTDNNDFILRKELLDNFRWSGTNMYYPQTDLFL